MLIGVTADPKVLPGTRVAVVEDDEGARKFIAMALRTAGYDVLEARDGDAALELLRDIEPVDALCVDAIVPGAPVERVIEAFRRRRARRAGAGVLRERRLRSRARADRAWRRT